MQHSWQAQIAAYFDQVAPLYAHSIEPVFQPLVEWLVNSAQLRADDRVLDLGCGTGLAAREAARAAGTVVSLDLSRGMVRSAAALRTPHPVQGDMHSLPFRAASFSVVIAAFALNSTEPRQALGEARRVLREHGRLVALEWDEPDDLSEMVSEIIAGYATEDPPPALAAFRDRMTLAIPWDDLDSIVGLEPLLNQAGFTHIRLEQRTLHVQLPDINAFIRYKLSWPMRSVEVDNMPEEIRALCLSDLRENLQACADASGRLTWKPRLIRIVASAGAG